MIIDINYECCDNAEAALGKAEINKSIKLNGAACNNPVVISYLSLV